MGDPGFISGMIGCAIQLATNQLIQSINIAIRCRQELDALKLLLLKIQSLNMEMQEYRKALNSGRTGAFPHSPLPSTVNSWMNELNAHLEEASLLVGHCTIHSYCHLFSRYRMSRKIRKLIANVEKHVASTPSIVFLHQLQQHVSNRQLLGQIEEMKDCLDLHNSALAGTSGDLPATSSPAPARIKYIEEALVVGQDSVSIRLEELIVSEHHKNVSRFGIVGKGGAGKTLLLKQAFNSSQVQNLFCNDLMLWLTVSQSPSFDDLRNELVKQIGLQVNERLNSREEDCVKTWLNQSMRKRKFVLFLDDVWETSATTLLEELCVPRFAHLDSNIIIATSRSKSVLSQMGVPPQSIIQMQDLNEDDSWRLFCFHAFPHNDGILPVGVDHEIAKRVCMECGGLPLALKVIGQAMAGIGHSNEWEFALQKLRNDSTHSFSGTLRLSYDALADIPGYGTSLQLCFLCLAAFSEDDVICTAIATKYWIGEELVTGPNPARIGEIYVNLLADRCLIEPIQKDHNGKVLYFRVHDSLYDLAHYIAEKEEKCFFQSRRGLKEFPVEESRGHVRISLMDNGFTRVPKTFGAPCIRSLLLASNPYLLEIPKEVIGKMTALRILDLSRTALRSLPNNMGCLKNLVCLRLRSVRIKRLPNSLATLIKLQILDLYGSHITQLPSNISKLTSLKLLDISYCENLHCLPFGISNLTSLEYLDANNSPNIEWNKCRRDRLSINDLCTLNRLKRLGLKNNGEIFGEGILGAMNQMETLHLSLTEMESLPHDMTAMSKLRKLCLSCPQLFQIRNSVCGFQHLGYIRLFNCGMSKLPPLHMLPSLKHLNIVSCPNIEKFPKEFGKEGAFPNLEVFSIVEMKKLEQLPKLEGALPSLKTLTIMKCEVLQTLPQCYWNLKCVQKIKVYGCPKVLLIMAEEENFIKTKTKVQTLRLSTAETRALEERCSDIRRGGEHFYYGEFWCSDMFQLLEDINHVHLI